MRERLAAASRVLVHVMNVEYLIRATRQLYLAGLVTEVLCTIAYHHQLGEVARFSLFQLGLQALF